MNFTREQFLGVFAAFNHAIWPMQLVALLAGLAAVIAIAAFGRCPAWTNRAVSGVLAAFWATVLCPDVRRDAVSVDGLARRMLHATSARIAQKCGLYDNYCLS